VVDAQAVIRAAQLLSHKSFKVWPNGVGLGMLSHLFTQNLRIYIVSVSNSKTPKGVPQHLSGESASPLTPGLHVVATPIGNLRDITLRALDVLIGADRILAEDTRQTGKLLEAYNISAKLTAFHDHNEAARIPQVLGWLAEGQSVALVSDAGTPLVSDPGFKLVREVVAAGYDVFPLPGASAVLAALVKSGLPSNKFLFAGFLPAKSAGRKRELEILKSIPATLIFFETGPRIQACLADMADILGPRDVVLMRELTKRYEESRRGSFAELMVSAASDPPRGELVVLIGPPNAQNTWGEAKVQAALLDALPDLGVKRASAEIAEVSGWSKREVYALALTLKAG
jgi:16S rRNA (cytidine1402-2'-O)-methyltransferase